MTDSERKETRKAVQGDILARLPPPMREQEDVQLMAWTVSAEIVGLWEKLFQLEMAIIKLGGKLS